MNWDDFRLVHAIAEQRSLVGAAHALGINHSTIFRRLAQIEAALGKPLFERSRAGYAPTAIGQEMVGMSRTMADGVLEFERRVAGRDERPRGLLRITTTDSFFYNLLASILGDFSQAYPLIELEILITSSALSLSRRETDVALRVSVEPDPTLVGRKIGYLMFGLYAKADGRFANVDPMGEDARFVGFGGPIGDIEPARWLNAHVPSTRIVARVNSVLMVGHAAAADIGIAVLPRIVGDNLPGLKRLDEGWRGKAALWLLTHADMKNSARVRAFLDYAWPILVKKRASMGLCEEQSIIRSNGSI